MKCPVCLGEEATILFRDYPGYQEPTSYDIARCGECNTSFALAEGVDWGPLYEAIYKKAASVPGYSRYAIYARDVLKVSAPLDHLASQEEAYWGIKEYLKSQALPVSSSILEVGSGLGYLTFALNKNGYKAMGLDICDAAVFKARQLYGESYIRADLADYAEAHPGEFDLVIATEVIEHLPDIPAFLQACLRLVKPGGTLLVTTPNREAWAPDVIWEVEGPPVHLWWLSKQSFQALADRMHGVVSFLDLSGFPGAASWKWGKGEKSRPVRKLPILDRFGELTPPFRPKPLYRRLLSKLIRTIKDLPTWFEAERKQGPSPTLCVIFRNSPTTGNGA